MQRETDLSPIQTTRWFVINFNCASSSNSRQFNHSGKQLKWCQKQNRVLALERESEEVFRHFTTAHRVVLMQAESLGAKSVWMEKVDQKDQTTADEGQVANAEGQSDVWEPLCGYLNKLSGKGPLKGFKRRWVQFNQVTSKLCFYRNSEDSVPLNEIDIKSATFTFDSTNDPKSCVFKIITPQREYALEAPNQETCLNWLQELQKLRKLLLTSKSPVKYNAVMKPHRANSGSISSSSVFYDSEDTQESSARKHFNPPPQRPISAKSTTNASASSSSSSSSPTIRHKGLSNVLNRFKKSDNSAQGPKPSSSSCRSCKDSEEQIFILSDDLLAVKHEFQASREVIKLLQQQLEAAMNEKETYQSLTKSSNIPESTHQALSKSIEQASMTESKLKETLVQVEHLKHENDTLKAENENLKLQVSVLQELLQTKDETVMSLTNELFDLQTVKHGERRRSSSAVVRTTEVENLQDSVKAYEMQNEFLNKEVVELNEIRTFNERTQRELELKCYEWEAKCCQVQSKLLSLLKEIKGHIELTVDSGDASRNISSNEAVKRLVNRLLDESSLDIPLSWHPGNRKRTESAISDKTVDYDDLGFSNRPQDSADVVEMLANKADSLKVKTEEMRDAELAKSYALWKSKWDSFVGNLGNNELQRSLELKHMLRSGVPQEYRCKIWRALVSMRVKILKTRCGNEYYKSLLDSNQKLNIAAKQIELDLLRTLPNNKHFENLQSDGTCRLRRVLTAYSRHNPVVGYCQGMNRLAAVALLFMPEEDAFWCLVAIIEKIMPREYYTNNLLGAHVDQYTFRDLLAEKLVTLHNHLEAHGVEISLFSWFLTCFVDSVPVKIFLRIWDVFLYEGSKVMFRFALAFLKYHEEEILKMNDSVAINQFLRGIGEKTSDVKQLCHIAFTALNPFPMSKVRAKRIYYTNLVSHELQRLEEIRRSLPADESRNCDSQSD